MDPKQDSPDAVLGLRLLRAFMSLSAAKRRRVLQAAEEFLDEDTGRPKDEPSRDPEK